MRAIEAFVDALEVEVHAAPDQQISQTYPDARAQATSGKETGLVGYHVQVVVDNEHYVIVAHEVINLGHDRGQLASMVGQTKAAMGAECLELPAGSARSERRVLTRPRWRAVIDRCSPSANGCGSAYEG